ncbi:phage gp6-like head-tail connector protein [Pantoea sp. YU22]|uniref:head-tail connector protein n=1 Tax=Pantoea sp. YU22 TaxID=2497684 RepID=UPI000F88F6BA|nr:head-tail connector protein [Pantoea sp. YU22]RTY53644.1 phage gp6-like head-tail connector protein [Pantoea sp. YU22]
MLLTLDEIKYQLRIEPDDTSEDAYLQLIGQAAESRTSNYLNRKLYAETVPEDDPDGLILPADVKLAMLGLVAHFHENRAAVSDVEMIELPMSFNWLVTPYRFIPL